MDIYGIFTSHNKKLSQGYIYMNKQRPTTSTQTKQIDQTLRLLALWIIQDRLATLFGGGLSQCMVYFYPKFPGVS